MSVAVRIRPLIRWSLARRFISVFGVSECVYNQRRAVHTESNDSLENEHRSCEGIVKTCTIPLKCCMYLR